MRQIVTTNWQQILQLEFFQAWCFCQLLGWIGVGDLQTEVVIHSDYNRRIEYLECKRLFANGDKIELVKGTCDFIILHSLISMTKASVQNDSEGEGNCCICTNKPIK